jgi:hypothetical protein
MRLYGCVSTYNEGRLLRECLRSLLQAVECVVLFEGPWGENLLPPTSKEIEDFDNYLMELHPEIYNAIRNNRLKVHLGVWGSQARKLTSLTQFVQRWGKPGEPVWAMHLDGDEVLLWPEQLRDHVERFTEAKPFDRYMNIKLVELDGTVGGTQTHLIRADLIEQYFVSGSQILFKGDSIPVALHNPDGDRFPIQGEPHILHRSVLRSDGRDAPELRAHLSQEADWFEQVAAKQGLGGVKPGD